MLGSHRTPSRTSASGVATLAICLIAGSAGAQQRPDTYSAPKMRVAVVDLSGSALRLQTVYQPGATTSTMGLPPPADFARGLTEMLTTALVATGRFVVVERPQIDKATGEQDFAATPRVNQETAAAQGRVIGAQTFITGDVTEFSYSSQSIGGSATPFKMLKASVDKVTATVTLDIRLVDAATGEVVFSQPSRGNASMTGVAADFTRGDQNFSAGGQRNTPLGRASREAIEGAVAALVGSMKKVRWSARVIDVRDGQIYINAGSDAGIQQGMELDVYVQQPPLVDPETGRTLATPDRKLGSVKVDAVEDSYCIASTVSGGGFSRNHLVRFKGSAETR